MSRVRVLVGTRKGAFILTSDGKRQKWDVSGPHFAGWEIYHLKGSPVDPEPASTPRSPAAGSGRSFSAPTTAARPGTSPARRRASRPRRPTACPRARATSSSTTPSPETGKPLTTHQWYDGTQHPWEFKRVWHLEPSLTDPDTVYAGVEDAALFRSTDGGKTWHELAGLRGHGTGPQWQPGAGGMGLHTILLDPTNPEAHLHRHLRRRRLPHRRRRQDLEADQPRPAVAVHPRSRRRGRPLRPPHRACTRRGPDVLFMQKHWDVMRSDDAGDNWHEVSGNLPTDFGFPIDVHAHEPETIYVVPIKSDSRALPARRQAPRLPQPHRRQRVGAAHQGPAAGGLLRQRPARRDVRRLARPLRHLLRHHRRPGLRLARRRRQLGADRPRPAGRALGRSADAAMIRVELPSHLRTLARVDGEVQLDVEGPVTHALRARRARGRVSRCCAARSATTSRWSAGRSCGSSPASEDLSHEPPDAPLPDAGRARATEPLW